MVVFSSSFRSTAWVPRTLMGVNGEVYVEGTLIALALIPATIFIEFLFGFSKSKVIDLSLAWRLSIDRFVC